MRVICEKCFTLTVIISFKKLKKKTKKTKKQKNKKKNHDYNFNAVRIIMHHSIERSQNLSIIIYLVFLLTFSRLVS